nr:immunoglobulin heavy chain junction region [Macaca mulatta]MOW19573.1 immunoglobulin heavy chain junction region [Macaca mulatta]MOW20002.1 immunoglobulin heavy chain junction region [Macaca mulatta]MOW20165.1 immunoglobulin heavy chain junction region [Macaca mulatta]
CASGSVCSYGSNSCSTFDSW